MPDAKLTQGFKALPIAIGVAVVALCVGFFGGMYYQGQADNVVISQKDALLVSMQQALIQQSATAPSVPSSGAVPSAAPTLSPSGSVPVTFSSLPKEGDRYCRDTPMKLSWSGDPSRVDEIIISVNAPFPAAPIADVPLMQNETGTPGQGSVTWNVGSATEGTTGVNIPDGNLYRITIEALYKGEQVYSQDSGTFAIDTCKG